MFNKSIFKQCVRSNGKLWAVFTFISCFMLYFIMSSYDASAFSNLSSAATGTRFESLASSIGSFLGTLETFYTLIAVLLAMVYTIITASSLIVNEVDSGSMAYTLSTSTRRITVVMTKALYMICSVALMFTILCASGIGFAELTQGCISENTITADVEAAAEAMDRKPSYVRDHLYMIQDDKYALQSGAEARDMDTEAYSLYLEEAMLRDSFKAAAKEVTEEREEYYEDWDDDDEEIDDDFIEITWEELKEDPSLMLKNKDALAAGAVPMGMTVTEYNRFIEDMIAENADEDEPDEAADENEESAQPAITEEEATDAFTLALTAAAKALGTDTTDLSENLIWMKEEKAMEAGIAASGLPEEQLNMMINMAMVNQALSSDDSVDFDMETYIWLNVGCFLLILAFSAIGFFASCLFNRSGNAMIVGGGLPFVFYLCSIMVTMGENLENFKYFTITTLYDTSAIIAMDDFGVGLIILGAISAVLYSLGTAIFCKKDLPL